WKRDAACRPKIKVAKSERRALKLRPKTSSRWPAPVPSLQQWPRAMSFIKKANMLSAIGELQRPWQIGGQDKTGV
ncbi:unnamed protein product, partial [Amoebophrya sp. A120]